MSIELKRKPNESLNIFLRRFSERVKRSGVLDQSKRGQFYTKPQSKLLRRASALQRKADREKMEYLRKLGKIK